MSRQIDLLREWGCDVNGALSRMLNDESFYIDCLNDIINDEYFEKLKDAINQHDVEEAFNCSHTLKGILSNCGLTPMFNKIVEIVEPLRKGNSNDLEEKLNELFDMREKLKNIIKND